MQPLVLSFQIALVATLACAVLGVGVGVLLSRPRLPGREVLDVLATAPLVLPPTVLGYYVLVALGRRSPLGQAFETMTGSPIVFTRLGAMVAATVGSLPMAVKAARAAFEAIDPRLVAAARTLGAGPVRAFFTVSVPLAARGILGGLTLSFARALGDFGITLMVAGDIPGETRTAALAVYDLLQENRDAEAGALVLVLTAVALAALYVVNRWGTPRHGR